MKNLNKIIAVLFAVVFTSTFVIAQAGLDLYLFDLDKSNEGYSISNKIAVTTQPGYDSQPFFHPAQDIVYYSSMDDSGTTDVFSYNIMNKSTDRFHRSYLSSEFSPTVTPDGQHLSMIVQGADGSQDLVKQNMLDGSKEILIDNHLVGYHIWLDENRVATFILNEDSFDLYVHDLKTKSDKLLLNNIGRCFQHMPGKNAVSFIKINEGEKTEIMSLDKTTLEIKSITKALDDIQDYIWTRDGEILMVKEDDLHVWKAPAGWKKGIDLSAHGLKGVGRMAINADNSKIVFVSKE